MARKQSVLWTAALFFIFISFIKISSFDSMDREVEKLEKKIHKRQQILEKYSLMAIEQPDSVFLEFEDFPEDMVIYKYFKDTLFNDTLQSWVNQFPVSNDEIDKYPFYWMSHLNSKSVTNTPLAYVAETEQYMNLGSAWYIVKRYTRDSMSLISALLVQTDFPTENNMLRNSINPRFSVKRHFSIVPVSHDESYVIKGKDGGILFSVLKVLPSYGNESALQLRLIAIVFIIAALFIRLYNDRKLLNFLLVAGSLILIRIVLLYQPAQPGSEIELFSPNLYADFALFESLAELLITNVLICLLAVALFMVRRSLALMIHRAHKVTRVIIRSILILLPLILVPYIHITLKSVILNSGIVLEIFKVDEISIYTLLVYLSYSLLFLALLLLLHLTRLFFHFFRRHSLLKARNLIIYTLLVSLYTLSVVSILGHRKENDQNRVIASKFSSDRDLNTELQLRSVERLIENDPLINYWIQYPVGDIIVSTRISETYLWNIVQRYNLRLTKCRTNDLLSLQEGNRTVQVPCNPFFISQIEKYGTPLYGSTRFFFMDNPNGKVGYTGFFDFSGPLGNIRLYLELDSKFINEAIGYPEELLSYTKHDNFLVPKNYSYGKYINNRLVAYKGEYNYPVVPGIDVQQGYSSFRKEGYIHFVNKYDNDKLVILSRYERNPLSYLITFSYISLFYALIFFVFTSNRRRGNLYNIPRNSFRWKITILIVTSLVVALLFMGAGSIWFSINFYNNNIRSQMTQKLSSVQTSLSDYSQFVNKYNDQEFNTVALQNDMNRLSNNVQTDINLYTSSGVLLRTTRSEIFDRFLMGSRINPKAYYEIVHNNKKQYVNREKIAGTEYYSLYAPLFNQNGKIIAIANIPYFSTLTGMSNDLSAIIATIINIYLLLLIAALFGGIALSNSIAKPLAQISRKMGLTDISEKPEHIDYNRNDELGVLVSSYNQMVDDLEESAKKLAQGEREQAWREMARQIAHEIKNPLTPMRLSIQHLVRLKEQGIEDWPVRFDALANSLIEQIDILSNAASEFSSFSRFYSEELGDVELNLLVREQLVLFSGKENIRISYESACREAVVRARKTQLSRLLVNLISNAQQSLDKREKGNILVSLRMADGFYEISVEDDGPGVPDNLTNRLFKPNFTTKSGGTGLGLAICRSIVEQSQGEIFYTVSKRLGGANFYFRLPVKERELFTSDVEKSEQELL